MLEYLEALLKAANAMGSTAALSVSLRTRVDTFARDNFPDCACAAPRAVTKVRPRKAVARSAVTPITPVTGCDLLARILLGEGCRSEGLGAVTEGRTT